MPADGSFWTRQHPSRPGAWRHVAVGEALLLKRLFFIDMQHCLQCGNGELTINPAIIGRPAIEKFLTNLGLDPQPRPRGRRR
jgi:hypothetical protein